MKSVQHRPQWQPKPDGQSQRQKLDSLQLWTINININYEQYYFGRKVSGVCDLNV